MSETGDTGVDETTAGDGGEDEPRQDEADALVSRLRVIEDQPLESRAGAFAQIYDELQARLDNGEPTHGHG